MKILYICTHNRCRSILSEAITNHFSNGRFQAFSAGSQPVGEVHPLTIRYLKEHNIPTDSLSSKSWSDFKVSKPDVIVTVCDSAANEVCPNWFGNCIQLHWGLTDPSKIDGDEQTKRLAFNDTITIIKKRIERLNAIEPEKLSKTELKKSLALI